MTFNVDTIQQDLYDLGNNYKTGDVDQLIRKYVKEKRDVSFLRDEILSQQQFHRIFFYVSLKQLKNVEERMAFIDSNLLFSDWWHTDQLIRFVSGMPFEKAYDYAKRYVIDEDPFVRRWGYVMFISKLCRDREHLGEILALMHNDDEYYVQMAEAWLLCELAVFFPEEIAEWLENCDLTYDITGKAVQKIQDSYRISEEDKKVFSNLRSILKGRQ